MFMKRLVINARPYFKNIIESQQSVTCDPNITLLFFLRNFIISLKVKIRIKILQLLTV